MVLWIGTDNLLNCFILNIFILNWESDTLNFIGLLKNRIDSNLTLNRLQIRFSLHFVIIIWLQIHHQYVSIRSIWFIWRVYISIRLKFTFFKSCNGFYFGFISGIWPDVKSFKVLIIKWTQEIQMLVMMYHPNGLVFINQIRYLWYLLCFHIVVVWYLSSETTI